MPKIILIFKESFLPSGETDKNIIKSCPFKNNKKI